MASFENALNNTEGVSIWKRYPNGNYVNTGKKTDGIIPTPEESRRLATRDLLFRTIAKLEKIPGTNEYNQKEVEITLTKEKIKEYIEYAVQNYNLKCEELIDVFGENEIPDDIGEVIKSFLRTCKQIGGGRKLKKTKKTKKSNKSKKSKKPKKSNKLKKSKKSKKSKK